MSKNIVIVPDGIAADERGRVKNEISFVYKAVLDFVIKEYKNDALYLAPANKFGADFSEQELAGEYLRSKGCKNVTVTPSEHHQGYIDTLGNAVLLKEFLRSQTLWPLENVILVSANLHAPRAKLCFKSVGFEIKKLAAVKYQITKNDFIVKRLCYYKCKYIHFAYEVLAFIRDFLRINLFYKTIKSIILAIFCDKSLPYVEGCCDFVIAQIERSPLHIKLGLKFLTFCFTIASLFCLVGQSNYRKIRFITNFEKLSKTTRMFISFIRSMSLIYACDKEAR